MDLERRGIMSLLDRFRKKPSKKNFDRENLRPVIRASICTGEQVAGFKNIHTGKFQEIMLIGSDRKLEEFLETYGIMREEIQTEY